LIKDSKVNSFGFVQNYLGKSITHSVRGNKIKREKRVFFYSFTYALSPCCAKSRPISSSFGV